MTDKELVRDLVENVACGACPVNFACGYKPDDMPHKCKDQKLKAILLLLLEENLAIMVEDDEEEWVCDVDGKKYQTKVARPILVAPILKQLQEEMK